VKSASRPLLPSNCLTLIQTSRLLNVDVQVYLRNDGDEVDVTQGENQVYSPDARMGAIEDESVSLKV